MGPHPWAQQNPNDITTICFSWAISKGIRKQAINKKKQKLRKITSYTHIFVCVLIYMYIKYRNHEHRSCYTLYILHQKCLTEDNQFIFFLYRCFWAFCDAKTALHIFLINVTSPAIFSILKKWPILNLPFDQNLVLSLHFLQVENSQICFQISIVRVPTDQRGNKVKTHPWRRKRLFPNQMKQKEANKQGISKIIQLVWDRQYQRNKRKNQNLPQSRALLSFS